MNSWALQQKIETQVDSLDIKSFLYWLGSNSILKSLETNIEVKDEKVMRYKVKKTVTVLNEEGVEKGFVAIPYNSFMSPGKIKGEILDKNNNRVRKLSSSEIKDYSNASSYSLYEDSRVLYFELVYNEFPYTITYEYEVDYNGYINWPAWFPQDYGMSVENAELVVSVPSGMEVRYKSNKIPAEPTIKIENGLEHYTWRVEKLPAVEIEPYGPRNFEQLPYLELAPNQFEIEGSKGMLDTWKSFGRWYYDLSKDRDVLEEPVVRHIRDLVSDVQDEDEKIRILYNYLQETTRYVNISLGLGGWQTYPAMYVKEKGYGDCKALTNYMIAMLKAIGIDAYPALIRSGINERDIEPEFPSNQFNHVVAFIPRGEDNLWLECTSSTMPFGEIGLANEDRLALVVKPEGGELIRTPKSNWHENAQYRKATVKLTSDGNAEAIVTTIFTGNRKQELRATLLQQSERDRRIWLENWIDIPAFSITEADLTTGGSGEDYYELPVKLQLPKFGVSMGSRMIISANLMEKNSTTLQENENRSQPVHLNYSKVDVDSIYYEIPEGFIIESLADPVEINPGFGFYSSLTKQASPSTVLYIRRFEIHKDRFEPEEYSELSSFLREVKKADQIKFLLKKAS